MTIHLGFVHHSRAYLSRNERSNLEDQTLLDHQSKDYLNVRQCGIDHCVSDRHSRYLHDSNVRIQDNAANRKSKTKEQNGSVLPNPPAAGKVKETTHTGNQLEINLCSTGVHVTESASQELNLRGAKPDKFYYRRPRSQDRIPLRRSRQRYRRTSRIIITGETHTIWDR